MTKTSPFTINLYAATYHAEHLSKYGWLASFIEGVFIVSRALNDLQVIPKATEDSRSVFYNTMAYHRFKRAGIPVLLED